MGSSNSRTLDPKPYRLQTLSQYMCSVVLVKVLGHRRPLDSASRSVGIFLNLGATICLDFLTLRLPGCWCTWEAWPATGAITATATNNRSTARHQLRESAVPAMHRTKMQGTDASFPQPIIPCPGFPCTKVLSGPPYREMSNWASHTP